MAKKIIKGSSINKAIRHGEVTLRPVDEFPAGKSKSQTSYIVGHSETGHHHVLESDAKFATFMDEANNALYVKLPEAGKLVHQKTVNRHKDLVVPAGIYKVTRKKEYDPFEKVMREVWD